MENFTPENKMGFLNAMRRRTSPRTQAAIETTPVRYRTKAVLFMNKPIFMDGIYLSTMRDILRSMEHLSNESDTLRRTRHLFGERCIIQV